MGLAIVGLLTGVMVDAHSQTCDETTECKTLCEIDDKACLADCDSSCHASDYQSVIILWLGFQILAGIGIMLTWWRHGASCESLIPLDAIPSHGVIVTKTEVKEETNKALTLE